MVIGNDGDNTWNYATIDVPGYSSTAAIGRGLNKHRDGNVFAVPIKIKAPSDFSDDLNYPTIGTVSVRGTSNYTSSTYAQFYKIPKREYKIHYSCMTGCDVFGELGNNTLEAASEAFEEAHTEFIIVNEDLNLSNDVLDISVIDEDPVEQYRLEIIKLKNELIRLTTDYNTWENNKVWVLGCKTFIAKSAKLQGVLDISIPISFNDGTKVGVCFIFTENETNVAGADNVYKKPEITSRVIHELGHIRGMYLRSEAGYDYLLTDETYTKGHTGQNNGHCLMRVPSNSYYDPEYSSTYYKETIVDPHFCYGHIQMLYNCTFNEGE
jgi:hypothetical protein